MTVAFDLVELARKDWVMIAVCLVTILIHMTLLYNSQAYAKQCNDHWLQQIPSLDCRKIGIAKPFNQTIQYLIPGQVYKIDNLSLEDTHDTKD